MISGWKYGSNETSKDQNRIFTLIICFFFNKVEIEFKVLLHDSNFTYVIVKFWAIYKNTMLGNGK